MFGVIGVAVLSGLRCCSTQAHPASMLASEEILKKEQYCLNQHETGQEAEIKQRVSKLIQ